MHLRLVAVLALVVSALMLSGCLGSSEPTQPQPPSQPVQPASDNPPPTAVVRNATAGPSQVLFPFKGHITAGAGSDGVGYVSPTGSVDPHTFTFKVGPGAKAIIAELKWADTTQDLDLELGTPDCDSTQGTGTCVFQAGGSPGAGDSPAHLAFTEPGALNKTGDWKLMVWGKQALNTDFTSVVTVFYGAMPPEGYTALGKSNEV